MTIKMNLKFMLVMVTSLVISLPFTSSYPSPQMSPQHVMVTITRILNESFSEFEDFSNKTTDVVQHVLNTSAHNLEHALVQAMHRHKLVATPFPREALNKIYHDMFNLLSFNPMELEEEEAESLEVSDEVTTHVQGLFDVLFPWIYQSLPSASSPGSPATHPHSHRQSMGSGVHSAAITTPDFDKCLMTSTSDVRPFGEKYPSKMFKSIEKFMDASRALVISLNVMVKTFHRSLQALTISPGSACESTLNQLKQLTPSSKDGCSTCLNSIRGCLTPHAVMSIAWTKNVHHLVQLIKDLKVIEHDLLTQLPVHMVHAMDVMVEDTTRIHKAVKVHCGSPPKRFTDGSTSSNGESSSPSPSLSPSASARHLTRSFTQYPLPNIFPLNNHLDSLMSSHLDRKMLSIFLTPSNHFCHNHHYCPRHHMDMVTDTVPSPAPHHQLMNPLFPNRMSFFKPQLNCSTSSPLRLLKQLNEVDQNHVDQEHKLLNHRELRITLQTLQKLSSSFEQLFAMIGTRTSTSLLPPSGKNARSTPVLHEGSGEGFPPPDDDDDDEDSTFEGSGDSDLIEGSGEGELNSNVIPNEVTNLPHSEPKGKSSAVSPLASSLVTMTISSLMVMVMIMSKVMTL